MTSLVRTFLTSSLLALALSTSACKEPDPNAFETHVANIKDSAKRASGFTGLEALVKTVVSSENKQARLDEFCEKVIPALEEVWPDAPEQHEKILLLLRDVARPEASGIWNKALGLDGSADARKRSMLALEGIRKARAVGSLEAVEAEFKKLIQNPKNDEGSSEEENGRVRIMMAEALGAMRDKKAAGVLVESLMQPREKQPAAVHRVVATALGQIGASDDKSVDALLTVTFRVPDFATSKNVGVRAKQALVAIGDPAIPRIIEMLNGKHEEVQKLAAQASAEEAGLNQFVIAQTAASILGGMGSPKAVDALLAIYPKKDCVAAPTEPKKEKPEGEDAEEAPADETIAFAQLRAVVANALGLIGDPKAVDALCECSLSSKNPGDMFEILGALGRVGGSKAVDCLNVAITTAQYSDDAVEKDFIYEARWNSARFAILAAGPDDLGKIEAAMATASSNPKVKKELEAWTAGLELAKKCKIDKECFLGTLRDSNADWFAREKAAYEVAKLADGDSKMATEIAKAYKVRNPDARVSMAWLPAKMMHNKPCVECAAALQAVLEAEKLTTDKMYQAAVLLARDSIAKLEHDDATATATKK